jgi:hypothetical protein
MTSHAGRLYALGAAIVVFFLAWAVVAAHPWTTPKAAARDPRLAALAQREHRLRATARLVQKVVDRRFADYRRQFAAYKTALARRQAQIRTAQQQAAAAAAQPVSAPQAAAPAAAPSVRVVTLPPLVVTRTS